MIFSQKSSFLSWLAPFLFCCAAAQAQAGDWGMMISHNNPAGSNIGLNFLYQSATVWGFEVGVGGLYGRSSQSSSDVGTWGDVDVKWLPSTGPWRPFLEGGMAFALGAGSSGSGLVAGSPFAGGGILYSGAKILFHLTGDYKFNSGSLYPAVGIGFKF